MDNALLAGHARHTITPAQPMRMLGYASRTDPFEGVHDELCCDAVAFEFGEERFFILALDLCWMDFPEVEILKKAISDRTGLLPEQQLINFSHTHSGPMVARFEDVPPDQAYMTQLVESCVRAVEAAFADTRTAFMSTAETRVNIGCNRRERNENGQIILGVNPDGQHLEAVTCWRLHRYGAADILLFTHPMHGTTLGSENMLISAEWMGVARQRIEQRMPDTAAVFLQGCGADQNPYRDEPSFERVLAHGDAVAEAVSAVGSWQTVKANSMRYMSRIMDLPTEDGGTGTCPIHGLCLGDCLMIGLGGEAFVEYAIYGRSQVPHPYNLMMLGYTDGSVGYLPTAVAYEEGGYEPLSYRLFSIGKSWAPELEAKIKHHIGQMIDELQTE